MARPLAAAACAVLLAGLVFATTAVSETKGECSDGSHREIEVGIVKAIGCFSEEKKDGQTVFTGKWDKQFGGIDVNGLQLTGKAGGGLQIVPAKREVKGVALQPGEGNELVQINSYNWPLPGEVKPLGQPIKLGFIAPEKGSLLLTHLILDSNSVGRALAGLSPIGTVETPVMIEEEGKGSLDLTIALGGMFTLKGHPQSATIALPTESGKGTTLDGFEIELEEIDAFKLFKLTQFEATYSASKKLISGAAGLQFNFAKPGQEKNEKGLTAGFALENGQLTEVKANATGLDIPIGLPPAGHLQSVGGSFRVKPGPKDVFELVIGATLGADFGPEIPLPWGKVAPVEADAALQTGSKGGEFFLELRGGVKLFRIPTGEVYLAIHSSSGVEFGTAMGIGLPSFKNNENDPFYLGGRFDGWIAKGHFQFEGKSKIALFSVKLLEARAMVNDRAIGACWTVIGFPGGAVYPYGGTVRDFGVGCGLDYYKEQYPQGARISALGSRTVHLEPAERIIAVKGAGAAPRFSLRSPFGQVLRTPTDRDASIQRNGFRHAFFVNEETDTTHAIVPSTNGNWTVTAYPGSARITSVKAGREAPKEKVTAEVSGRGVVRTLTWDSLDRPHTRLLFLERLPSGQEVPILQTDEESGSRRFRVVTGAHYGKRNLRVVVIHGYGSRQSGVVDDYRVAKPPRLSAPKHVAAWRDEHRVHVTWAGVEGAHGYLVEVSTRGKGKQGSNFVRRAGAGQRSLVIPRHPGGQVAVAKVYALNRDDRQGRPGRRVFATGPAALSLDLAAQRSADSVRHRGNAVTMRMTCPSGSHCQVLAGLRVGRRTIARERFQQTPDSFHLIRLVPRTAAGRQALRAGEARLLVRAHRTDEERAAGLTVIEP